MKPNSTILLSILLTAILLFPSCQKDLDEIEVVGNESLTTNLFGTVIDRDGNPISNADVNFKNKTIQTDEYGTYLFEEVEVDSRYNHLNIRKEGYFLNTRTFRASKSEMILLKSTLLPASFDHTILSNVASAIVVQSIRIEFDGKGMVTQEGNENYEGEVEVAVQYLDPLDQNIGDFMPGDMSGIDGNNRLRLLESFGMLGVELRSTDGRRLQLTEGSSALVTIEIPEDLRSLAPETIPLWHFDHASGLWVEEGSANKFGTAYLGNVNHFSYWNFDLKREPVIVSGRLVDANGIGLASMQVKIIRGNERRGGSGYTDYDGYFSGPIEKNASLDLIVTSRCDGEEIVYSEQIGPFDKETDLGDIVLDVPNIEYLSVVGEFLSCDGEILEDGLLKINDQDRPDYFPVRGGKIDKTFGICGLESIELEIIDRQQLQKTSLGSFDVPGTANLNEVQVCDDPVNFVTINSSTFDLDLVFVDSVKFSSIQWSKSLLSFDYSYEVAVFEIKYVDQVENNIEEGTHKILKMVCNWLPTGATEEIVLVLYEGNIDIEKVDNEANTVEGSFLFEATIAGTGSSERHVFEGEFFSYF